MDLTLMKPLESHEIAQVIEKASLFGGRVTQLGALQNHQSLVTRIEFSNEGKILLTVLSDHALDHSRPVSVNLAYRNLVFRANPDQYTVIDNTLICTLPQEAKALTLRDGERFILPHNSDVGAMIHRIEKRHFAKELEVKIVDVSRLGLGLHVHGISPAAICKNDHIWIKTINQIDLKDPAFGKIQYVSERKFQNNSGDLRIGLSLDKQLPEEIFQELVGKCGLILSA